MPALNRVVAGVSSKIGGRVGAVAAGARAGSEGMKELGQEVTEQIFTDIAVNGMRKGEEFHAFRKELLSIDYVKE